MGNKVTGRTIRVLSSHPRAGPYIEVPVSQLNEVKSVLDNARISYWVDAAHISVNGEPPWTVINLKKGANAAEIQKEFDKVA